MSLTGLTPQPVVRADEVEEQIEALRAELESLSAELADVEAEAEAWEARAASEGRDIAVTDHFLELVKQTLESTVVITQGELREARDSAHVEAAARLDAVRVDDVAPVVVA